MGYLSSGKNTRIFPRWSHCNGLPTQGKIRGFFKSGHIVMGYLPSRKIRGVFKTGHIVMGYLPSGENYEDFSKVVTL